MKNHFIISTILLVLSGCGSTNVVVERNAESGHFPSNKTAAIVKSEPIDIDAHRALIVVGNSNFMEGQVKNIGYFDEVLTIADLETRIIRENLTDRVPSLRDRIGLNNAAKHYRPFLWLRTDTRIDGRRRYAQFILTDALTLDDYFIAETFLDVHWAGVNDKNNWYPMFNALIDYIEANSDIFTK